MAQPEAATLSEGARRIAYLNNLHVKAPSRALLVGILPNDLPAYIQGLVELGLLDTGERITSAGTALKAIAKRKFVAEGQEDRLTLRDVWRHVNGAETVIETALDLLIEKKLIRKRGDYYEAVL